MFSSWLNSPLCELGLEAILSRRIQDEVDMFLLFLESAADDVQIVHERGTDLLPVLGSTTDPKFRAT